MIILESELRSQGVRWDHQACAAGGERQPSVSSAVVRRRGLDSKPGGTRDFLVCGTDLTQA